METTCSRLWDALILLYGEVGSKGLGRQGLGCWVWSGGEILNAGRHGSMEARKHHELAADRRPSAPVSRSLRRRLRQAGLGWLLRPRLGSKFAIRTDCFADSEGVKCCGSKASLRLEIEDWPPRHNGTQRNSCEN